MRISRTTPLLVLLTLTAAACSEGRPPGAPPPQDTSLIVSFSSDEAEEQGQAAIVIEIVRVIARSDGGQDVDLGAPDDGSIDLVAVDGAPVELVGALVGPGNFTGIQVEFAPDGVVTTPAGVDQDMTLTETVVTADGEFSVEDGTATEIELLLDLGGRLTFDAESGTWELDPRNLDLLS